MIVVIAFLGAIVVTVLVVALGMFRQTLFSPHRVILAVPRLRCYLQLLLKAFSL